MIKNQTFLLALGLCLLPARIIANPVTLPFKLHGEHILLELGINGKPGYHFIFDMGEPTTLSSQLAKQSDWLAEGNAVSLQLGETSITHEAYTVTDLTSYTQKLGLTIDGVIGQSLFEHYVIEVNYEHMEMTFTPFEQFKYHGKGKHHKYKLVNGMPMIKVKIELYDETKLKGKFLINTGASGGVIFNSPIVEKYNLLDKVDRYYTETMIEGINVNKVKVHFARVKEVSVFGFVLEDVPTILSETKKGLLSSDEYSGMLGNTIMKRYNIIFHKKKQMLYLEKNAIYGEPYLVNCSGIELQLNQDETIQISTVIPDSPADSVGIKPGDVIHSFNGHDSKHITLEEIRMYLEEDGRKVKMEVMRDDQILDFEFQLKKLI